MDGRRPGRPAKYTEEFKANAVDYYLQSGMNLNLNLPRFRLHPYAAFPAASSGQLALSNSSGLRYPSAECVQTLLQEHSMHSKIARAA